MSEPINRVKAGTRVAQETLVSSIESALYQIAIAKAPWLSWPVIRQVFRYVSERVLYYLTDEGIILFNSIWIRVEISGDVAELEEARQRALLALDEGANDEQLDKIDQDLIDAFDRMHRGSRNPI